MDTFVLILAGMAVLIIFIALVVIATSMSRMVVVEKNSEKPNLLERN